MIQSIFLILLAAGLLFFAQQNTQTVSVTVANYAFSPIPVYLIAIVSLLLGLLIASIFGTMDFLSNIFTLRRKDKALSHEQHRLKEYEDEVASLKHENAVLQEKLTDRASYEPRQYLERLRNKFAFTNRKEAMS